MYLLLKMDDEPLYERIIKAPRAVTPNEAFNDRVLLIQTFKKGIPVNGSDFISRKAINEEMRKEISARYKSWNKKITVAEIATLIFDVIENVKSIEESKQGGTT